jgi:hypothetical protein
MPVLVFEACWDAETQSSKQELMLETKRRLKIIAQMSK